MKSTVSGRCFATCKFESIATCKQLGGRAEISSVSRESGVSRVLAG